MPISEATRRKMSEAQKGKRRGKHPSRVLNIDFDVERRSEFRVKVALYNDVGGGALADFTISGDKARRLASELVEAAGGADRADAFLVVEDRLDFEGYSRGTRVLGYATTFEAAQAFVESTRPTFSAQTGRWTDRAGNQADDPRECVRSVQPVSPVEGLDG